MFYVELVTFISIIILAAAFWAISRRKSGGVLGGSRGKSGGNLREEISPQKYSHDIGLIKDFLAQNCPMSAKKSVVYIYADYCPFCRQFNSTWDNLVAQKQPGVCHFKLHHPDIKAENGHGILSAKTVPAVYLYDHNSGKLYKFAGAESQRDLGHLKAFIGS